MRTPDRRTIFLARHCETAWNLARRWQGHTDVPLNARGRGQATALAERLRDRSIGPIRASDLSRAKETADIVAQSLGVADVTVDPDLRERYFGVFEGLTREECAERHPDLWARYEQRYDLDAIGAEPEHKVLARMLAAFRRAVTAEDPVAGGGETMQNAVLVVGHGASLRALLSMATGLPVPPITNGGVFRVVVVGDRFESVEDLGADPET